MKTRLPKRIIRIEGAEAKTFLQGQVSSDVAALQPMHCQLGTANTPKGRIYALYRLLCVNDQTLLMQVHESIADSVLTHLKKYAVFSKCELSMMEDIHCWGVLAPESAKEKGGYPKPHQAIELGSTITLGIPSKTQRIELWTDSQLEESEGARETWQQLDCLDGLVEINDTLAESFIVQELNLDHLDAVSFKKGCYTGQEIIARMKYLGKQKKRLYLLSCSQSVVVPLLTKLHDGDKRSAGTIVRWEKTDSDAVGLAVLNQDMIDSTLFLDHDSKVSFEISALDYGYLQ